VGNVANDPVAGLNRAGLGRTSAIFEVGLPLNRHWSWRPPVHSVGDLRWRVRPELGRRHHL